jgi:hypothetical protein
MIFDQKKTPSQTRVSSGCSGWAEERRAVLWRVFSEVVILDGTVERGGEAERGGRYDFHESIVNALRPTLKEGVKSIVIAAPARTD